MKLEVPDLNWKFRILAVTEFTAQVVTFLYRLSIRQGKRHCSAGQCLLFCTGRSGPRIREVLKADFIRDCVFYSYLTAFGKEKQTNEQTSFSPICLRLHCWSSLCKSPSGKYFEYQFYLDSGNIGRDVCLLLLKIRWASHTSGNQRV